MKEATTAYKDAQDPLRGFIEERCVVGDPNDWASGPDLRRECEEWAKEAGAAHLLGPDMFGKRLSKRGCSVKPGKVDGKTRRIWYGIRLRTARDEIAEQRSLPELQ